MRTILLPLDGSVTDRWALETALAVAAPLGAHVTALLPKPEMADVPVYGHYASTAAFATLIESVQSQAEASQAKARQMLEEVASSRGVRLASAPDEAGPTVALESPSGDDPGALILRLAAVHDLVLYPRLSRGPEKPLPAPPTLKTTLQSCGRPVLILTDVAPARLGAVAIAWNGSNEGGRAVGAALPFLHRADRVVILTVVTSKTGGAQGDRLRDYLMRHGLQASVDVRETMRPAGDELVACATEHGADLLVTGCYTHSRVRQSLFGGVTHRLLENCSIPMLMAH